MLQNKTKWLAATTFLGIPLALVGCGGGGGSSNSSPRATATPVPTFSATPAATPSATGTAVPTTFSITANFSETSGALPFAVRYTQGTASISSEAGNNTVTAKFGDDPSRYVFSLNIVKAGAFKAGDVFTFANSGTNDKTVVYTEYSDGVPPKVYSATSGTFKVTSLVSNPATTSQEATVKINFTLLNVQLQDTNSSTPSDLMFNAGGQFTATDLGEQK